MTLHQTRTGAKARDRVLELLNQVGLSNPHLLVKAYPHQAVRRSTAAGGVGHRHGQRPSAAHL